MNGDLSGAFGTNFGAEPDDGHRQRRLIAVAVAGGVLLLIVLYVGFAMLFGSHVPSSTSVGGVAIGGKTHEEALATLERELHDDTTVPVEILVGDEKTMLIPSEAGLSADIEASLDGLTGFSLNPLDVVRHISGGTDRDLVTHVDAEKLAAAVAATTESAVVEPRNGSLSVKGGTIKATSARAGLAVDVPATADAVADQWPTTSPVEAATTATDPAITDEEVERVRTEFADEAVSGPVTVVAGSTSFEVTPKQFAPAISFTAEGSTLQHKVDEQKITEIVMAVAKESGAATEAKDATVTLSGGTPTVVPAVKGTGLKADTVAPPVIAALTSESRKATVEVTSTKPETTTEEAKATLPTERISTFTTTMPYAPERTENIRIAANTLNGAYVAPGETFSLNARLGERTPEKGYNEAPVIMNGRLTTDHGGGISQLSTTLFNAIFFSGARIEDYLAHSFYIDRYPEGREATISWPNVDQKFTNDLGAGILIKSWVHGDQVTVEFWGQKKWEIKAEKSERRNITQPEKIVDDSKDCVPQHPAIGFDVTVDRIFLKDGREVKRSDFYTHYIPEDEVICTYSGG